MVKSTSDEEEAESAKLGLSHVPNSRPPLLCLELSFLQITHFLLFFLVVCQTKTVKVLPTQGAPVPVVLNIDLVPLVSPVEAYDADAILAKLR